MTRYRPSTTANLYKTLRITNENAKKSQLGYTENNIYLVAPLTTSEGAGGHYVRIANGDADRR